MDCKKLSQRAQILHTTQHGSTLETACSNKQYFDKLSNHASIHFVTQQPCFDTLRYLSNHTSTHFDKLSDRSNHGKAKKVYAIIAEYKKLVKSISNRQWKTYYQTGKLNKNLGI